MTIVETKELGGLPHIEGHRIGIHHIVSAWTDDDYTIEEIADRVYPKLTEGQVREALIYAFDHKEQFEKLMEKREGVKHELEREAISQPEDLPDEYRKDPDS